MTNENDLAIQNAEATRQIETLEARLSHYIHLKALDRDPVRKLRWDSILDELRDKILVLRGYQNER